MSESGEIKIWKEYEFNGKYQPQVPPGENHLSGPCLRNSLFQAGISTDLPHWTRTKDTQAICEDLRLKCFSGAGISVELKKNGSYIIGWVIDQETRIGHFEYTTNIEKSLADIDQKDIFAIIEIPPH